MTTTNTAKPRPTLVPAHILRALEIGQDEVALAHFRHEADFAMECGGTRAEKLARVAKARRRIGQVIDWLPEDVHFSTRLGLLAISGQLASWTVS